MFALAISLASSAFAQHSAMPAGMTHEQHMAQMKKEAELKAHGNVAMGFDQDKTTHHFTMSADGGAIEVSANDAADTVSIQQVRSHLQETAAAFAQGDFGKPLATHSELPPGAPVMQRLKAAISFRYADMPRGGTVRIATTNPEALAAVQEFLTYQVTEHQTGDPVDAPRR